MTAISAHPTNTAWTARQDALDDWLDVGQSWVLFLDVLGERAAHYHEPMRYTGINLGLYRTLLQPWVRGLANALWAQWMRRFHPPRVQYAMFWRLNPFMRLLGPIAAFARIDRHALAEDNLWWQMQTWFAELVEASLGAYRDMRERGFDFLRRLREGAGQGLTLSRFKQLVREQFLVLLLDERRAVEAIPTMLGRDPELAQRPMQDLRNPIDMVGVKSGTGQERLQEIEAIINHLPRDRANKAPRPRRAMEPHAGGELRGRGLAHALNVMMR
jgi:hypothetical protein